MVTEGVKGLGKWAFGNECPKHPSDDYIPQQSPEGHTTYSGHKECNGEWSGIITINFSGGFFSGQLLMVEEAIREFVSLISMKILEP